VTFVLRVAVDDCGHASAVIELVRTGRKEAVQDIAALGAVVTGMLRPGVGAAPSDTAT
jgi:hypothetical protein